VKLVSLILAGGIVCLYGVAFAIGDSSKAVDLSAVKWVTQNPPTSEELSSSVYVVEFWATWCKPCRDQASHIKSLVKKYEDRNVIFIGLSEDRSISDVRKYVEKKNINYHIGMDNGVSDRLGVSGIPKAFVISHEGEILWSGNPSNKQFEETLKSAVSAAPKAMLDGVDLGRFSYLRIKLCGGKNFAKAYSELEGYAKDCDCSEKICACKVFGIVNEKLREKIAAAQQMRDKDPPQVALLMYKEIIDNYSGINLIREVESVYLQLQKEIAAKMPVVDSVQAKAH
jgi:thiol-disulfide isomerase/thioredoxin